MNILELIRKNDPNVQIQIWDHLSKSWQPHKDPASCFKKFRKIRIKFFGFIPKWSPDIVRGLVLRSGMRVVVKQASKYWSNYAQGEGVLKFRSLGNDEVTVLVGWTSNDQTKAVQGKKILIKNKLVDVKVPPSTDSDLVIEVPLQKGAKVFLGVHRLLDRNELYVKCKGNGIEIGPGPKPQILPSRSVQVKYIEQATPEQWKQLYGIDTKMPVDEGLWQHYEVGNADKLPASRESLDFIFSSHVIEHLANPLGHLAYWATLLKPKGFVVAIIPDLAGCKDYVFDQSTISELEEEYRLGSMEPTLAHYERWGRIRVPNTDPAEILESGRSIHVHFYTPQSMRNILEKMYRELGFRKYSVVSEYNHKDFFVVLEK